MARTRSLRGSRPSVVLMETLLFVGIVSASMQPGAIKRQATATQDEMDFSSLTGCHFHDATQCAGSQAQIPIYYTY